MTRTIQQAALTAVVFAVFAAATHAQDLSQSAIWKFSIRSTTNGETFTGGFRLSNNTLFQKASAGDRNFSRVIGVNRPQGNRTQFRVKGMRLFKNGRYVRNCMGIATLRLNSYGKWSGTLTDARGRTWTIHCLRVKG